ncbi:MAG: GAF domain-containing protein, partial [Betaproteobacteria bacterium]|nr:GAF domain-containing protein [Betaproteobacteria bacterium]
MNGTSRPQDVADLLKRVEQLNRIGVALSQEKDITRLLEAILVAAKDITNADGGTLYRMSEERTLRFEIMRNDTLGMAMGGTSGVEIPFYPVYLYDKEGKPIHSMVAAWTVHHDRSVNIADAYTEEGFDFSGTKNFDKKTGYRSKSFLTVPMKNHENEIIGVLQLINCKDRRTGEVVAFSQTDQQFAESLASQAAIALTNRLLINHLENLFESFINLINAAIDDKSPYTGGHCERVPMLTMMLAEAVNNCKVGPLRDFTMTDKDRYELKIAGLLHDCGKVTTPVHVVDKATKLQTIFDRVHLLETRFEVVKRDLEIALRDARLAALERHDGQEAERLQREHEQKLAEIDAEREFLRRANIGGEAMGDADIERVRAIASRYQWRDVEGRLANFLTDEEVTNLTIRAGTLTAEERQIINHHIEVTIQMLEALPWP